MSGQRRSVGSRWQPAPRHHTWRTPQPSRCCCCRCRGFAFSGPRQYRDALHLGDCDEGVRRLCQLLGWEEELEELVSAGGAAAAAQGGIVRGEAAAAEGADRAAAVVAAAAEAG